MISHTMIHWCYSICHLLRSFSSHVCPVPVFCSLLPGSPGSVGRLREWLQVLWRWPLGIARPIVLPVLRGLIRVLHRRGGLTYGGFSMARELARQSAWWWFIMCHRPRLPSFHVCDPIQHAVLAPLLRLCFLSAILADFVDCATLRELLHEEFCAVSVLEGAIVQLGLTFA